jgi:hypothetical protein
VVVRQPAGEVFLINYFQGLPILILSQPISYGCHEPNGLRKLHILWPSLRKVLQINVIEYIFVQSSILSIRFQVNYNQSYRLVSAFQQWLVRRFAGQKEPVRPQAPYTVGVGVSISTCFTSAGHDINFDLVWPSSAIPNDFFPSNATFYGECYYIAHSRSILICYTTGYTVSYTLGSYSISFPCERWPLGFRSLEYFI